jgi:kynurenine 3-monooxygenase
MRATIVGGGLAGSLLAVYLGRHGFEVNVFERHADERVAGKRPRGSKRPSLNITLCERGLAALDEVGAKAPVLAVAAPARGRIIHVGGALAHQPYGNAGEAIHSIARSTLNDVLLGLAESTPGVRCHFGARCTGIDVATGTAWFEDGSGGVREARADLIFGADGAFSCVRQELQKHAGFNFSQTYWRHGGYKTLVLPGNGDGSAALESGALHIWPRGQRMLIGFPNADGSVTLSLLLPLEGPDSHASLGTEAELVAFFRRTFTDVADRIPALWEQFSEKPANSLLTIRCDPWSSGARALLLGDAAHAILPSYGQGANAAFEDCAVLDRCIGELAPDFDAVFREFERRRRPNLDVMAGLCVEHFTELCELVADPTFLERKNIERRLEELYPELYHPLYSMISFTSTPYAEALRVEQRQRVVVDRVLASADPDAAFEHARDELATLARERAELGR